jgi:hypothetical protein
VASGHADVTNDGTTNTDTTSNGTSDETTRAVVRVRKVRRLPIVIVLVVLLIAAIVVGNGRGSSLPSLPAAQGTDASAMPLATARSTAWYCPGPPPSARLAHASEQVSVSNLMAEPIDVGVTTISDKGLIESHTAHTSKNASATVVTGAAADGAAIIEPFSANVAVQSTTNGNGVLATAPCATQPASEWEFANGTTTPGTEDWIVLFNPFGDDAIVDVSFMTEVGFARPDPLQSMTVPRRSRVAIPVHTFARYHSVVATSITAHTGRVVAQQTLIFSQNGQPNGVTRTLGAVTPVLQSVFASGASGAPNSQSVRALGITDPTDADGQVYVQITPASGKVVVQPVTISIARHSVVTVQLGNCPRGSRATCIPMPDRLSYSVLVHATRNVGFVVQDLARVDQAKINGANAMFGTSDGARNWVFAGVPVAATGTSLDFRDVSATTATVSVTLVANGNAVSPAAVQHIAVAPGNRTTLTLTGVPGFAGPGTAIVVRSDQPVVAERSLSRADDSSSDVAIPARD